jgi:hypothetical protein
MEMIESIVWMATGFISTVITMEIAWRLARQQTKRTFINKPIAMNQEVRSQ